VGGLDFPFKPPLQGLIGVFDYINEVLPRFEINQTVSLILSTTCLQKLQAEGLNLFQPDAPESG